LKGGVNIRESYLDVKTKKVQGTAIFTDFRAFLTEMKNIQGYFPRIDTPTFFHYTPCPEMELISVLNH
jgi:hypothetical protein